MFAVAIDGPSGAGKSSVAKAVAKKLNFIYVDTGALYRSIALYVSRHGIDENDESAVASCLDKIDIKVKQINFTQHIFLNGEDVTEFIRTPEISLITSKCSAIFKVREFLFSVQVDLAMSNNSITDGRDIGTTVLPNANLKIFLTADAKERARRRHEQLGGAQSLEDVLKDVLQRDYDDTNRAISPLKKADDAVVLDSTNLNFDEVVQTIYDMIKEKINESELD